MAINLFLSTILRKHVENYDSENGLTFECKEGQTVADVLDNFKIPEEKVFLVVVDGEKQTLDYKLKGNEKVGIFPPVAGG